METRPAATFSTSPLKLLPSSVFALTLRKAFTQESSERWRPLRAIAIASIALAVLSISLACDPPVDVVEFDGGPLLDPCASMEEGDDDSRRLPLSRVNSQGELRWERLSPTAARRGRASFSIYVDVPSATTLQVIADLPTRDHDAFVPAASTIELDADGRANFDLDLYLLGPWQLLLQPRVVDVDLGEEVRFAFCVAQ